MTCRLSEYNKVSLSSKIVLGMLKFAVKITGKRMLDYAFSFKRNDFKVPMLITKKYKVKKQQILNNEIATIIPISLKSEHHIVYFHGGAYIAQGSIVHWLFINEIVKSIGCKVTYIDYPLAPESNYKNTFEMVNETYKELLIVYSSDKFIFAGDSAGGGLALAYAQNVAKENKLKNPEGLILLSPWLDLTMKNRSILKYESKDTILSSELLLKAAEKYAAGDDLESKLLSPIYGSLKGLGRMLMMVGTSEIMYPDCELLFKKAEKTEAKMKFSIYKGMPHIWIMLFLNESKAAMKEICEFVKSI